MSRAALVVSRATAGFLERGHPWVRPDRFTRGLERLRSGQLCDLVDERGRVLAQALADPEAEVCARMVPHGFDPARLARQAWERRAALHADPDTDCYRVIHGEADGLPGLRVERFADLLIATVTAACILPYVDDVLRALPPHRHLVHRHLDDLRRQGLRTTGDTAPTLGRELGVRYPLRPGEGLCPGLYVDQRATRAWLRGQARGRRVLNLFAYTGAFSLALLAAGAVSASDVDLAGPALARAAETAVLNGLAGHRTVHADCRAFLTGTSDPFDIIIIDPPTAAQGGGGWVSRRDYPHLLAAAWTRLAPGGILVATSNTVGGKPFALREAVAVACPGARPMTVPALGADLPQLPGFPEGRPYRLAAVRRP